MRKLVLAVCATVALGLALPSAARSQAHIGPQVSIAEDVDLGIGGRVIFNPAGYAGWEFGGHFDYFFPDAGDYWEINGNGYYNFSIEGADALSPYVGTGLNVARFDGNGGGDTDLGVNFIAGSKFPAAERFSPFVELRVEAGGGEQWVITGGLMF